MTRNLKDIIHSLRCTAKMLEDEAEAIKRPREHYTLNGAMQALCQVAEERDDVRITMEVLSEVDYAKNRKPPVVSWTAKIGERYGTGKATERGASLTDVVNIVLLKAQRPGEVSVVNAQDTLNETPVADEEPL